MLSNQVSWTDILAFGAIAPVCFLARHDVAGWPALGLLARLFGTLFVERGRILSLIHISEPTRLLSISYAVFCLKKKITQ